MQFKHLLAKSTKDPGNPKWQETLVGHTEAVLSAAEAINEMLAESILNLIQEEMTPTCWQDALFCAAWLHDLGKANDHFQTMLRRKDFCQGIRHETLGIVVADEFLKPSLLSVWRERAHPEWLWSSIIFAVAGHHLKFPDTKDRKRADVTFLGEHQEIKYLLEIGQNVFGFTDTLDIPNHSHSLLPFSGIQDRLVDLRKALDRDFTLSQKLFIASLKACLMCADLAGSALPAKINQRYPTIREWVEKRIAPVLQKGKLEDVVKQKLRGSTLREFQKGIIAAGTRTVLVEAGCGAGKTAAAYLWADRHTVNKRLFFCYPTTATASEGFAGYIRDPDFEAILVNSRADIDYRLLEDLPPRAKSQIELRNLRLEAIDTWPIPVVVCTAHTVLGLLQNTRRGIYAWPSMARAAFVFDEVHSYPPKLFAHLLRFLVIFRTAPVLLMTATLPPERKEAVHMVCRSRGGLSVIGGPDEREKAKRYSLSCVDENSAYLEAQEVLNRGGKVLWICNTVSRAIGRTKQALNDDLPVQPFHSRYRYRDRVDRQRAVVKGFRPKGPPIMAVTTQVAEMSLDLSADLLISEYAPLAAMIQRLGRLNRFEDVPPAIGKALFYKPENALPYAKKVEEEALWHKADAWFSTVADGCPKSQRNLAEAFLRIEEDAKKGGAEEIHCDWIDDPWVSLGNKTSLMEPGYTVELVRQEDLGRWANEEIAIPMPLPRGTSWQSWPARGRFLIAPPGTIQYDIFWGAGYAESQPEDWII